MYEIVKSLIGDLPVEFTFIYAIITLVLGVLVITFLFQLFYIPLNIARGKWLNDWSIKIFIRIYC